MSANKPVKGVFVTGTDTGVGKTIVAAALARFLGERGLKVGVMKPAESGVADPTRPGPDASLLQWASGCQAREDEIAPYRLRAPLSPAQAARQESVFIDFGALAATAQSLAARHDFLIVEGAGGLMSPLAGGLLMADLARQTGLPLLVVTSPRLGTINQTLLTIFAAQQMDIPLAGYLVNRMPERPNAAEEDAPHTLASLASASILGVLSEVGGSEQEKVVQLAASLRGQPSLPWLLAGLSVD